MHYPSASTDHLPAALHAGSQTTAEKAAGVATDSDAGSVMALTDSGLK